MSTCLRAATTAPAASPPLATSARASWSGELVLGPLAVPVKAYPAVVVPSHGPLHQVHADCGERISQRKFCPKHGELASSDIGKAFEYGPNDSLTLTDAELDALQPPDDQKARIEHLVAADELEPSLLSGRSLFLVPSHPAATPQFARAVGFLSRLNVWGVGRMVLSEQQRVIAVRADQRRLLLCVLHWPEHCRVCPGPEIDTDSASAADLRALEKSLSPLQKPFAWDEYRDGSTERLNTLIATKLAARDASSTNASRKRSKATACVPPTPSRPRRAA